MLMLSLLGACGGSTISTDHDGEDWGVAHFWFDEGECSKDREVADEIDPGTVAAVVTVRECTGSGGSGECWLVPTYSGFERAPTAHVFTCSDPSFSWIATWIAPE